MTRPLPIDARLLILLGLPFSCHGRPEGCPPEMARVEAGGTTFCLDRWEATIREADGRPLQEGLPFDWTGATARATQGTMPTIGITFEEARAACSMTRVADGDEGVGMKHLATTAEWLLGADGLPHPSIESLPTEFDPHECNVVGSGQGHLAPTGSFPRCRSRFGVFDQYGNAFEWTDPQISVDIEGTLGRFSEWGWPLSADADGWIRVPPGTLLRGLTGSVIPSRAESLHVSADGFLVVEVAKAEGNPEGYLFPEDPSKRSQGMLPVRFVPLGSSQTLAVGLSREDEGSPISEKAGPSYYVPPGRITLNLGHPRDFRGTISFRCASGLLGS